MTSTAYSLALTPWERAKAFVDGHWRFTPNPDAVTRNGKRRRRKKNARFGLILGTARDIVSGVYGDRLLEDIATEKAIMPESLRVAVWKVKRDQRRAS